MALCAGFGDDLHVMFNDDNAEKLVLRIRIVDAGDKFDVRARGWGGERSPWRPRAWRASWSPAPLQLGAGQVCVELPSG